MPIKKFYITGKQKRRDLFLLHGFGQIRIKTGTGQKKSQFKEPVVGKFTIEGRVSFQGVKSLSGHFACLCRGFDF